MMVNKIELDATDKTILKMLINDARSQYLKIAKKCNMTSAAIYKRVRNLKKSGIIRGSQINIDPKAIGWLSYIGFHWFTN